MRFSPKVGVRTTNPTLAKPGTAQQEQSRNKAAEEQSSRRTKQPLGQSSRHKEQSSRWDKAAGTKNKAVPKVGLDCYLF
jgi:hypothetical protein